MRGKGEEERKCSKCGGERVYLMSDSFNYWCPDYMSFAD
ncbi:hypothetical protein LCGC14_2621230 [marine sediment metagenome]|uniref:Uncharacterized protein n=1 Tax=marine sediment metagenome TaxID=412755 RepID=A0A0F9A2Y8_9ZZZZ